MLTEDMDEAKTSIGKLAELEFDTACFGRDQVPKGKANLALDATWKRWQDGPQEVPHNMIRVSVLYPPSEKFDHGYYINSHMKMVKDRVGDALIKFEVDKGLAGGAPGSPPPYAAVGHLYFNSLPEFMQAFGAHAGEIMGDVPNFTDAQGEIQISEIISG